MLYSAYRSIFNKNYDISIKGIPCEVYVELDDIQAMSNGMYSLSKGWVKRPTAKDIPDIDYDAFESLFDEWEDKYFSLLDELGITPEEMLSLNERGEEKESSEKVYDFIEDIYDLRKESIANEGEYGIGNLVFKEFRNLGYLDALKALTKMLKGKELSLEAIQEDLDVSKYNTKGKLMKLRQAKGFDGDGTYSQLEDGSIKKEEKLKSGYMVSFFRSEITNKWIDAVLKEIGNRLGAPYFGIYKSLPEISYMFKDKDRAMDFAKLFNQESIWDNSEGSKGLDGTVPNKEYDENAKVDYAKALEGLKAFLNGNDGKVNEDSPC